MKRFYKTVDIAPGEQGIEVHLDGRPVRTPAKRMLRLPTAGLARAVAEEWSAQEDEIDARSMHLTRLANSAIDRVADHRAAVVGEVAGYAGTDLVCYRADEPEALAGRQREAWDPLVSWVDIRHGAALEITTGILPVAQPDEALARLHEAVAAYDDFALAGLHMVASATGSLVLALATAEGEIDAEEAWRRSLVDETFQIEEWGEDEEATRRRAALREEIGAAAHFLALCRTAA